MAQRITYHLSEPEQHCTVMDSETGKFTQYDFDGAPLYERALTAEELALTNLPELPTKVAGLTDVVDQLILDALMNSMGP